MSRSSVAAHARRPPAAAEGWQIALCGELTVVRDGQPLHAALPARQGRLIFAYLALNRERAVARDELLDALWPGAPPVDPGGVLSAVLTRLRRALGEGVLIAERSEVSLELGTTAWIDVEAAAQRYAHAAAAVAAGDHRAAIEGAAEAANLLEARLLPEFDGRWVHERRNALDDLRLECLELIGRAALEQGEAGLPAAQRAAVELVRRAPYRESGYATLMRVHATRGDAVEAIRVFDRLRSLLRDELGTTPSPGLIVLNEQVLRHEIPARRAPMPPPSEGRRLPPLLTEVANRPLVGRSAAVELLERRLRDRTGLVLITGEAGIGKTHLVAHVASEAASGGTAVLYGRCDEEALTSYQPFVEMLSHHIVHTDLEALQARLPAEMRELQRLLPSSACESAPDSDTDAAAARYRMFQAVAEVLRDAAGEHGLMLIFDDLHWADKPTLLLLQHALRSLLESPVTVVGTRRSGVLRNRALVDLVANLQREHSLDRITLEGFDEAETAELFRTMTLREAKRGYARRLCELTAGNPFFIAETLRTVDSAPSAHGSVQETDTIAVPEGVREVVLSRLSHLSATARSVTGAAAVIGRRFELSLLAVVLDRPADELLTAVEEIIEMQLVEEIPGAIDHFTFSHDLVRETRYAELTASRRVRLHERIARALKAGDAPPAELARHFFEARHLVGAETASSFCLQAGRAAAAALAHEDAVEQYERALVAREEGAIVANGSTCELLLELGDELERMHDVDRCREAFAAAAELAARQGLPELQARAACGFAKWQRYGAVDYRAIELLERALAALPADARSWRAKTLGRLATRLDPREAPERREALYAEALAVARALAEPEPLRMLLPLAPYVLCRPQSADARLELAVEGRSGDANDPVRDRVASLCMDRFLVLFELGRLDEADSALDEYRRRIDGLHQPWLEWQLAIAQATRAVLDRRYDEAEGFVDRARAIDREADAGASIETWAAQSFMLARARGRMQDVDADAVARSADKYDRPPVWRALHARVVAELDGEATARAALAELINALRSDGAGQEWLPAVTLSVETADLLKEHDAAAGLRRMLEPYAGRMVLLDRAWATWGPVSAFLESI